MTFDDRPDSPSPSLLDRARADLARRLSLDPGALHWGVGRRLDRKRSTLFHLTLYSAGLDAVATAYYKKPYFPGERRHSRNLARARTAILSSEALGGRFAELADESAISVNVTLAIDPETLEVITLGLVGQPLGNPLRFALTPARREEALTSCFRVGRAIRIIEDLLPTDPAPERDRIWQEAERKLESATGLLTSSEMDRLETLLKELYAEVIEQAGAVTFAHGDLSPGNVILMKERTGLIDFMWIPQLRGFDLARFVHRLRYTTVSYKPWTESLVEGVLDGYGDSSAPEQPGWRFSEMQRLLTTAEGDVGRLRPGNRPAREALDQIRASLRSE